MTTTEHLDKIYKLGFFISISWNEDFEIYYNADDVYPSTTYSISILRCSYVSTNQNYTYRDMIDACCDIFYGWYNKNLKKIRDFDNYYDPESLHLLEDFCLGDITKNVTRDLNLDGILPDSDVE